MENSPNRQVNPECLDRYEFLVRSYLQDFPENNKLLPDTEEFSGALIRQNVLMALELFNTSVGYLTNDTLEKFPVPTLLVIGAAGLTIISGGVLQTRNHFSVSDGGLGGPLSEKSEYYKTWGESLLQQFVSFSTQYKNSRNTEGGYGSVSSSYLNTFADTLRGR